MLLALRTPALWIKILKLIFLFHLNRASSRMIYYTSQSCKRQSYSERLNHGSHKYFIWRKTQLN